jgi:hypothetical protein
LFLFYFSGGYPQGYQVLAAFRSERLNAQTFRQTRTEGDRSWRSSTKSDRVGSERIRLIPPSFLADLGRFRKDKADSES